ncbi:MAG TPA: dethiobiotin synthase [Usitatibacter sp.]|jgi:dethiobiotin synthetase|nr:dethiobiotin synthase [Usitatibacter sp.]
MRGVFVTGTDTGVGKTFASTALICALRARGLRVFPFKPVAAGAVRAGDRWINEDTQALLAAAGLDEASSALVTPVLLREPMAPHIAARREGVAIDLRALHAAWLRGAAGSDVSVVEGVGGFCVPLDERHTTVDLARMLSLPVLLVVGMRLGCLNHALLTAQAVEAAGLTLAGWIANELDCAMNGLDENVATLESALAAPLLGRLPWSPHATPATLAQSIDGRALLEATR